MATTSNTGTPFPTSSSMGESSGPTGTGSPGSMSGSEPLGSSVGGVGGVGGVEGVDRTLDRFVQGAHQAVDTLAAKAAPAVERLKSSMGTASDSMHERADQLSAMQEEWIESARATVREHPIASLAAAVAVGMLISRLTSSR